MFRVVCRGFALLRVYKKREGRIDLLKGFVCIKPPYELTGADKRLLRAHRKQDNAMNPMILYGVYS